MGFTTWHNYGYGICVSDIKEVPVERLQAMLKLAPNYNTEIHDWFETLEINAPTYEDYIGFDDIYCLGLATLMQAVIEEAEGIVFVACDNFEGEDYLLYPPNYPWWLSDGEAELTEEKIREVLQKYLAILTDEEIDIGYQSAENGG